MEVFFVDVGQGSCQIITLGNQRAIVIDAGGTGRVPLNLLQRLRIEEIDLLAISHNDTDHRGGATRGRPRDKHYRPRGGTAGAGILGHFGDAIKTVAFVDDGKFEGSVLGKRITEMLKRGELRDEQVQNLNVKSSPENWWESDDSSVALDLISPHAGTTIRARNKSKPDANATSAVFLLSHNKTQILFTGDSQVSQWRTIDRLRREAGQSSPLTVDVASVPHHGGVIGTETETNWYYDEAISSSVSVVSVGSKNQHHHPDQNVIGRLRDAGHRIFCTQIGEGCSDDVELVRPGVVSPARRYPGQSEDNATKRNHGRRIACAGTLRVLLSDSGYLIDNDKRHEDGVDSLQANAGCHPMCRG